VIGLRIQTFAYKLLDLLLPQRCVVCVRDCRNPLSPGIPLCADCSRGLDFVTGRRCPGCGKPLISEAERCTMCRDVSWNFDSNTFLFQFQGDERELVLAYKFGGRRNLAKLFAGWLLDLDSPGGRPARGGYDAIVPVPALARNVSRRGFDQALVLAGFLSRLGGIPLKNALGRRGGRMQKSLTLAERKQNLKAQLYCKPGMGVGGKILLADDIFTSGTTADECARLLKENGAREVHVFTLAMEE
jgi:competence protein ComFC